MRCAVTDLSLFPLQALHIIEDIFQQTPVLRLGVACQQQNDPLVLLLQLEIFLHMRA